MLTQKIWKFNALFTAQRAVFIRSSHAGTNKNEVPNVMKAGKKDLHLTSSTCYPKAKNIPLPNNVEDINASETVRFSPERSRDITGDVFVANNSLNMPPKQDMSADRFIESYDCSGSVSLNSAMQTNVPDPYAAKSPSHLNMPGGERSRLEKFVAQDLHNSHYTNFRDKNDDKLSAASLHDKKGTYPLLKLVEKRFQTMTFSTVANDEKGAGGNENSNKDDKIEKLKKAVKDYGATVIVFHVGISLISLGGFYLAVTSGIDLNWFTFNSAVEVPGEVGAFVVAYAIHKMFAPVRISITLLCTPLIVRYLRRIGVLSARKRH